MISRPLRRHAPFLGLSLAALLCWTPAAAQNWSGDARRIAMGGVGTGDNLASKAIEEEHDYRVIVIPLGLFQVLRDLDVFDPGSDEFDLVRAVEYAASPLHYTVGRDDGRTTVSFVNDLRNAQLNRNLKTYRGFVPVTQPVSYGLANPSFGVTIPVYRSDGARHGIFVGAGPYLAMRADLNVDPVLVSVLDPDVDAAVPPNAALPIGSDVRGEAALAITGGYRGHFAFAGGTTSEREGLYVALNYSYLRGFRMEEGDILMRFDTDANGELIVNPFLPAPLSIARTTSTSGSGRAIDFGVAAVVQNWEVGFGVNGVANQIEWTDVEGTPYVLGNLFGGGDFVEGDALPLPDVTLKQPVEYIGNVGYRTGPWSAVAQLSKKVTDDPRDEDRLNDVTFRVGTEYRFLVLEPRAGAYYTRERWQPAAGLGINLGAFGIDGAVYWTDANVERERKATFALSLRIGRKNPLAN